MEEVVCYEEMSSNAHPILTKLYLKDLRNASRLVKCIALACA